MSTENPPADKAEPTPPKPKTEPTPPKPADKAEPTPPKPADKAEPTPPKPKTEPTPPKPADKAEPTPPKPADKAEPTPPKPADKAEPTPPKPADKAEPTPPKPADKAEPTPPKPAKKPEAAPVALPEFEKGISDKIVAKFGDRAVIGFVKEDRVRVNVDRKDVHDVAEFIRDTLNYDHVESVSGVDYPADNEIEVVYHIGSYSDDSLARQVLVLATRAQRETNPIPGNDATKLPTLRDVFYSVEFHEREVFEMFGVYFEGHPDNRRLLLPEDWADLPPLRKDFAIKGR